MLHRALTLISVYKDTNCVDLCTNHCKILEEGSVWTSRKDLSVLIFENSVLILKLFNVEVACSCNENISNIIVFLMLFQEIV